VQTAKCVFCESGVDAQTIIETIMLVILQPQAPFKITVESSHQLKISSETSRYQLG